MIKQIRLPIMNTNKFLTSYLLFFPPKYLSGSKCLKIALVLLKY